MRKRVFGLLSSIALLLAASHPATAAEPPEWKEAGKFRLPGASTGMFVSDDHHLVFAQTTRKVRRDSGGVRPGFVEIVTLRCFAAETGKELFATDLTAVTPLMSVRGYHFAFPNLADKILVYDVRGFREVCKLDTRLANDSPPGSKDTPAAMGDFGGGGRLDDLEFTADGKTLVTIRKTMKEWKPIVKKGINVGWSGQSIEQATFWDVEKGAKIATLDCEDENATDAGSILVPRRKQMLVKFANGARMLDLESRKWGTIFPIKKTKVRTAGFSPDENKIVVADFLQNITVFDIETGKQELSFKVRAINRQPDLNPPGTGLYAFGPDAQFVDDGKVLRVTLNDHKTVVYHDAATGAVAKRPASEVMTFPGGPAVVLALSRDRRCAVTAPTRNGTNCTLWLRGEAEKKHE